VLEIHISLQKYWEHFDLVGKGWHQVNGEDKITELVPSTGGPPAAGMQHSLGMLLQPELAIAFQTQFESVAEFQARAAN